MLCVSVCVCVCVCVCACMRMCVCVCERTQMLSRGLLFVTLWTVASPAPLSIGFSREEYGSRVPFPPPGHLPNPEIEPESLTSPALADGKQ